MRKEIKALVDAGIMHYSSAACKSSCMINYNYLPTINNELIKDIWRKNGYWLLVPYFWNVGKGHDYIKCKELPIEFDLLLTYDNKAVNHFTFHARDSGHASQLPTIEIRADNDYHYILPLCNPIYFPNMIDESSFYAEELFSLLGKKMTAEPLDWFHDVKFDCSYLQRINGMVYPDTETGYRGLMGDFNPCMCQIPFNTDNIRMYHNKHKAHFYLKRETDIKKGVEDLVRIKFPNNRGNQFCVIDEWAYSKKEDPGGIIKYNILDILEDNWPVQIGAMIGNKVQFKRQTHYDGFYRIMSVTYL